MKKHLSFSVILLITFTFCQKSKEHYQIEIGKYKISAQRILNITTQEIIKDNYDSNPVIIKFPARVDSVTYFDRNGDMHRDTSTTSYFAVEKIQDTISGQTIDSLINSEIKVAYTTGIELPYQRREQKVTGFKMQVFFPDGTSYNNYIEGNRISMDKEAVKEINKRINGSYIELWVVFFLNDKGEEMKINNPVAWKLKY